MLVFQLDPKSSQCEFPKFLKVEGRENFETKALQEIHLDGNAGPSYSSAADAACTGNVKFPKMKLCVQMSFRSWLLAIHVDKRDSVGPILSANSAILMIIT